jgi:membrane associated rhomboid family serine protease
MTLTSLAARAGVALRTRTTVLTGGVLLIWIVFAANSLLGGSLFAYGIIPRTQAGLRGLLFAPFIHGNMAHILANTVSFLLLGWLVMLRDPRHFLPVTLYGIGGAGLAAWLFGASGSVHIGASGVIFAYLGFLMLTGWFARSAGAIVLSIVVTVLWGGLVFGVLPGAPGVSWQAHLGGFVGGVIAARRYR